MVKISRTHHITKDGTIKRNPSLILYHGSNVAFNKFTLDGINTNSNDEEGVGIYLTDSIDEAKRYGKYVYIVRLRLGRAVPITGSIQESEIRWMINHSPEREVALSNYAENPVEAINSFFSINNYQDDKPHEMFKTVWYDFYRNHPKEFIRNMITLGYDYVKVKKPESNHYIVYNPDRIEII